MAVHADGKLSCGHCGHEVAWSKHRQRMRRRLEHLSCTACGYAFTWQSWRASYAKENLFTASVALLRRFESKWGRCETARQQMTLIDGLLHAVHDRGALGPVLIEGHEGSVMELLDQLAQ